MDAINISPISELPRHIIPIQFYISGGTFEMYLTDMVQRHGKEICLLLDDLAWEFSLPCLTGQGTFIDKNLLHEYKEKFGYFFSDKLQTNVIFNKNDFRVILFDDKNSLRKKAAIAAQYQIAVYAANHDIIKKLRLSD